MAKTCPKCGAKRAGSHWILWSLVVILSIIVFGLFAGGSPPTPQAAHTYGDLAEDEQASCARKHPDAPASYCREQGLISASKQVCKDKPWLCK